MPVTTERFRASMVRADGTPLFHRRRMLEHVALWTPDLERSRAFYERYFGGHANARYANTRTGLASYFETFAG